MPAPRSARVAAAFLVWLAKRARVKTYEHRSLISNVFLFLMHVAGFACLTYAAFTLHSAAGWVMAGVSCFILAQLVKPKTA